MRTITTYTERRTITTNDEGRTTTARVVTVDTVTAYRFNELSPEAQQRAAKDAAEQEASDYYNGSGSMFEPTEGEIWQCAEDFEKTQPVEFFTDYGGSPNAKPSPLLFDPIANKWRSSGEPWELVTLADDNGICYSMDLCDEWNRHAPRIIQQQRAHEFATEQAEEHYSRYTDLESEAEDEPDPERRAALQTRARYHLTQWRYYDTAADRAAAYAEKLTEAAAYAVGCILDGNIEAERDYYQSAEFWAEYFTEDWNNEDPRFDKDGKRIS